jgi:ATP-dependent exoDNAse (exonuclease V) beta subunit
MKTSATPLIIYKASAGSGKTFRLAIEYIKLVIQNPQAYKRILAVTFTNKATEEMKMRILSQLYGLWCQLPSSQSYMDVICKELDASPEFVSKQSGQALSNLLHNYSYFRIDTIDSFFQNVLRNLARELDLTANLRVGLNDTQVEEMAVDELIENLSAHDQILQWILNYIMETINDDKSWNIIQSVKKFGHNIFKDEYKAVSQTLNQVVSDPKFFDHYISQLRGKQKDAKETLAAISDQFFQLLSDNGIDPMSLSYGKGGVAGFFLKLKEEITKFDIIGPRVKDSLDNPEKWCKKDHPQRDLIRALASGPLNDLLHRAVDEYPRQYRIYMSAELTLKHLNKVRLLESIERKVNELNIEANRFLLSDTQQVLHKLIEGSDSPFIFEKIGTQLEHIMIDEFQDTSTVQWKNFKILLQETMSHENAFNLIVGDVKQSIYRWRNGDWQLLQNISSEFPQPEKQLSILPLKTNYRSCRHVIDFNNAFFTEAAALENISAYSDVEQFVPEKKEKNGYVQLALLKSDPDYQDRMLDALLTQVEELLSIGVPMTDIAILVRKNNLMPLIANFFMEHLPHVPIVSDEAFQLSASPAIQIIVHALRLLNKPDDVVAKALLAKAYSHHPLYERHFDEYLPEEFITNRNELLQLPLYELTEKLCAIFHLNEMDGQTAYLCAFYDQVSAFVNEQMTDIDAFLNEWDESICTKSIQSPDIHGIRLISIHKSKGLEYPYVLIPFCDWKLEMTSTLWCYPSEEPFNQLPIVPVEYAKGKMDGTIYEKDAEKEQLQNMVDNMNLLYVAFTRASKGLYVWGKRGKNNQRSATLESVMLKMPDLLKGSTLQGAEHEDETLLLAYGVKPTAIVPVQEEQHVEKQSENVFLTESVQLPLHIQMFDQKVAFKQSNLSRQFAASEDEEQQNNYIQLGSVLHNVFSTIRTKNDIDGALQRMELEGILYDQQLTREKIESLIRKRLSAPRVAEWYDAKWQLFNECSILNVDKQTGNVYERRPDRVMTDGHDVIVVDFKFGKPQAAYHEQVKEYMQLLSSMGCQHVKGYLWYVYSNKIDEVK